MLIVSRSNDFLHEIKYISGEEASFTTPIWSHTLLFHKETILLIAWGFESLILKCIYYNGYRCDDSTWQQTAEIIAHWSLMQAWYLYWTKSVQQVEVFISYGKGNKSENEHLRLSFTQQININRENCILRKRRDYRVLVRILDRRIALTSIKCSSKNIPQH